MKTMLQLVLVLAVAGAGGAAADQIASSEYKVSYFDDLREPKGSVTTWLATNSGDALVFYLHNQTSGSNWVVNLRPANGLQYPVLMPATQREPKGSTNTMYHCFDNRNIGFYLHNNTSGDNWIVPSPPPPISLPYTLKDADSGVIYYVEQDGRHVTAINPDGAILWHRDPFADAHMQYYRTNDPRIVRFDLEKPTPSENWDLVERVLGKKGVREYISISFNSSQTGFMDITTGDFFFTGQD
jgi:hypothetical protein